MTTNRLEYQRDRLSRATQIESMRESLARPGYDGHDYFVDKHIIENRTKNRKCTDVLFTLTFLAFLGLMVWIVGYSV